jgi:uncharacterized C2H2 Zn-finger protein
VGEGEGERERDRDIFLNIPFKDFFQGEKGMVKSINQEHGLFCSITQGIVKLIKHQLLIR